MDGQLINEDLVYHNTERGKEQDSHFFEKDAVSLHDKSLAESMRKYEEAVAFTKKQIS